jgi:hypothetical protein
MTRLEREYCKKKKEKPLMFWFKFEVQNVAQEVAPFFQEEQPS